MNPVKKANINALAEAVKFAETPEAQNHETVADFVNALLKEPDKKIRRAMIKDFSARRKDVAQFLKEHADLIDSETEMALISAAVGSTHTEKKVSYRGGKRVVSTSEKHIAPNAHAATFLLKNRMPDKYSDKPAPDVEIEDVSEIEEDLYGDSSKKDDTV